MIHYENLSSSNSAYFAEIEEAISRVVRSGWYVIGNELECFEREFANYMGSKHCIGVANGLDALVLSIDALGLPPESEILVAANTYIATILSIIRSGHKPVLVEPDIQTFNIDPKKLQASITSKTKAICVTHLFGKPCRMDDISILAEENGLKLVEDCAQSHGASFKGQKTGTFGNAGCFSFYPTKNLGAFGDAGAVVTDDDQLANRLRHIRNYGSKLKYHNQYLGYNSRLDEIQAAILRVKLAYLDKMTAHKRKLANVYFDFLPSWLELPLKRDDEFDVYHIFGVRHERRDELKTWLLENDVGTEVHYPIPPHSQPAMRGILNGNWPITDRLHKTELSLPISYGHTVDDIRFVCDKISAFN